MTDDPTVPPQDAVRVFVVEDQTKILKTQLKLLESSRDIVIVGTALSGESALEALEVTATDVLLLDLGLPRMDGIEVTKVVKARWPSIEILIFTIFDEEDRVLGAVKAGASGYLLKGTPADKIIEAIREVKSGGTVIQPNLARKLLRHFRVGDAATVHEVHELDGRQAADGAAREQAPQASVPPRSEELDGGRPLSEREQEILQLIAKGVSNNEAARALNLSKATIRTHLEHIYRKLEVTNRVEAVTEGIRKGIISV